MKLKTFLISLFFITFTLFTQAQPKGIEKLNLIHYTEISADATLSDVYEKVIITKGGAYTIIYEMNTAGYKKLINMANYIIDSNSSDFKKPTLDQSLLPIHITSILDYENMHKVCSNGAGELLLLYNLDKVWQMMVSADETAYSIYIDKY